MEDLMSEHASRMDIVRLHQRAEDAENEMRQAQLIAAMEAQATNQVKARLDDAMREIQSLRAERETFLHQIQSEKDSKSQTCNDLEHATGVMGSLRADLEKSRQECMTLKNAMEGNNDKVSRIFSEREMSEANIRDLTSQLAHVKKEALEERNRIVQLGEKAMKDQEERFNKIVHEHNITLGRVQGELSSTTEQLSLSKVKLEETTANYEGQIADLKSALLEATRRFDDEKARCFALDQQLENINKTIWLRKYDHATPRTPLAGLDKYERTGDPHVGTAAMYAGNPGYSRF